MIKLPTNNALNAVSLVATAEVMEAEKGRPRPTVLAIVN